MFFVVSFSVDPPGNAENVSLDVSPTMDPFAVNLHIRWLPPSDLGSSGVIEKYMIRSGKAVQLTYPLPASFIDQPVVRNVSQVSSRATTKVQNFVVCKFAIIFLFFHLNVCFCV